MGQGIGLQAGSLISTKNSIVERGDEREMSTPTNLLQLGKASRERERGGVLEKRGPEQMKLKFQSCSGTGSHQPVLRYPGQIGGGKWTQNKTGLDFPVLGHLRVGGNSGAM